MRAPDGSKRAGSPPDAATVAQATGSREIETGDKVETDWRSLRIAPRVAIIAKDE